MGTFGLHFGSWNQTWQGLWAKLAPSCSYSDCTHSQHTWERIRRAPFGVRLHGSRYCIPECLDRALVDALQKLRSHPGAKRSPSHRIPIGLLLLSRQLITDDQLRAALEAQRRAGCGRLGDWLERLGFVSEQQVTAALARQWSCPVWRAPVTPCAVREIPVRLLQSCHMLPVSLIPATSTLHIAFSAGIDYTGLYAIEQMLGYRTEPCVVTASALDAGLQLMAEQREASQVVFDRVSDAGEFAQIIRNYAVKSGAFNIRMARCGGYVWVRLERLERPAVSLLLNPFACGFGPLL